MFLIRRLKTKKLEMFLMPSGSGEGKRGKEFEEWYVEWHAEWHNYAKYDLRGK